MKLQALFALVACLTGAATYFGATALGSSTPVRDAAAVMPRDTTPTAAEFARALEGASNQFAGGRAITRTHCVKAAPAHYMCAYAIVKPTGDECHLMQGMWTPGEASTITVTLAGRAGRCDSVRDAVQSLGQLPPIEHELRIQTRWGDFDALGHLNHVSYLVYCDEARDAALAALGGGYVVARQEIDYRREIPLGAREIVVRTRVVHVGTSSVRLEHDVADGAATSSAVVVAWDREARTKRALTQDERDALLA